MSIKKYSKKDTTTFVTGYETILELFKQKKEVIEKVQIRINSEKTHESSRQLIYLAKVNHIPCEFASSSMTLRTGKEDTLHIAYLKKYKAPLEKNKPHILLVSPQSSQVLGEIIRICSAFNYNDIAILNPATDIFSPTTINASFGRIFDVRFEYFNSIGEYHNRHKSHEFLVMTQDRFIDTELKDEKNTTRNDKNLSAENICIVFFNTESTDTLKFLSKKRLLNNNLELTLPSSQIPTTSLITITLYALKLKAERKQTHKQQTK